MKQIENETRVNRKRQIKKEKKLIQKQKIRGLPWWRKAIRYTRKTIAYGSLIAILLIGSGLAYAWTSYGSMVKKVVTEGYAISEDFDKNAFIQRQPTIIYDKNGEVLKELKDSVSEYIDFESINPYFREGIIAVEDKRFYLHHGVDLYGTIRSMSSTFLQGDTQGGSTLTQQLVRNVILQNNDVSIERKLKEQVVAQELEKFLTKEEIVQYYLNNVFFGNGNYGIAPASHYYFGKDQSELTAGEVAIIIGITNNPALFDPIKNPDNATKKRNRVLKTMLENEIIDEEVYQTEIKKSIELNVTPHQLNNDLSKDDLLEYTIHKATESLMQLNGFSFQYVFQTKEAMNRYEERYQKWYSEQRGKILSGGYEIDTSIDPEEQASLEAFVKKEMSEYRRKTEEGLHKTQVSITTIDNKTGNVIATVGGRGDEGDYLNRSYQSPRQPGSAAKPIVSYANAFEIGYAPQSMVVDSEIPKGPKNWYKGYWGNMTIRYALEQSVNTVAYKLANKVGIDTITDKLSKMHFSHLTPDDNNPIISVGGFTKGVTTIEMASAYSTLVRNGLYVEPTNIMEIRDIITKEILVENKKEPTQVFREDAAYFTVDALRGVLTNGTGKQAKIPNYKYAFGKTGTTNDNKDSYFAGGTPYYTTAIWVGYDMPSPLTSSELNLPKQLFSHWNQQLHKGLKEKDFNMPKSVSRSGNNLYSSLETYQELQTKRKRAEENRMQKERERQRERLALEDYRIIHHLTTEEEQKRESMTEKALEKARNFQLKEVEDFDRWMEVIDEAYALNEKVKHQRAYDRFKAELDELVIRATVEKDNLLAEIKRKEEEKRKKEEEEAREQEQINQLQQSLTPYMAKVERGETLTEEEYSEMQTIIQQLQEKGVPTPQLNVDWIEPEEPEETEVIIDEKVEDDSNKMKEEEETIIETNNADITNGTDVEKDEEIVKNVEE